MSSFQDSLKRLKSHHKTHAPSQDALNITTGLNASQDYSHQRHSYSFNPTAKHAIKKVKVPPTLKSLLKQSQHRYGSMLRSDMESSMGNTREANDTKTGASVMKQGYEIRLPTTENDSRARKGNRNTASVGVVDNSHPDERQEMASDMTPFNLEVIVKPPPRIRTTEDSDSEDGSQGPKNGGGVSASMVASHDSSIVVESSSPDEEHVDEQLTPTLTSATRTTNYLAISTLNRKKPLPLKKLTPSERIGRLYSPTCDGLSPKKMKDKLQRDVSTLLQESSLTKGRLIASSHEPQSTTAPTFDSRYTLNLIVNKEFDHEEKEEIADESRRIEVSEKGGFLPLVLFDDDSFELHTPEEWIALGRSNQDAANVDENGTKAKSRFYDGTQFVWKKCRVVDYNPENGKYGIFWVNDDSSQDDSGTITKGDTTNKKYVTRFNLIFDEENEHEFHQRVRCAQMRRRNAERELRLSLQIEKIPDESLTDISDEQIHQILRLVATEFPKAHIGSIRSNVEEMERDYSNAVKKSIFEYEMLNPEFVGALRSTLDLPKDRPAPQVPQIGTVDVPPYDFIGIQNRLAAETFYTRSVLVETLVKVHEQADNFVNEKIVDIDMPHPCSLLKFLNVQSDCLHHFTQKLKKDWIQKVTQIVQLNITEDIYDFYKVDVLEKYKNSRMRRVIRLVSVMLSHQLRSMVEREIRKLVNFVTQFHVEQTPPMLVEKKSDEDEAEKTAEQVAQPSINPLEVNGKIPLFNIAIVDKGGECIYKPSLDHIHDGIREVFENIYFETAQIPEITNTLYPLLTLKQYYHNTIKDDEEFAQDAWETCARVMIGNRGGPEALLELFKQYEVVLGYELDTFAAQFDDEFMSAKGNLPSLTDYKAEIERLYKFVDRIRSSSLDEVNFDMVRVDCAHIKSVLENHAMNAANSLLNHIADQVRTRNKNLSERYKQMFDRIQEEPKNAEELDALKKFIAQVPDEMASLRREFQEVQSNVNLLHSFEYNVSGRDFTLYIDTFGWPKEVDRVLKSTTLRLESDTQKFQEQLQQDVRQLFRDVAQYKDELKIFTTFDDVERVEKCYGKVKEMSTKINAALEKAKLYNSREQMFNWPITEFVQLEELVNLFDPHKELWTIAYMESQEYPEWMEGAFQNLDPEQVELHTLSWLKALSNLQRIITDDGPRSVAEGLYTKLNQFKRHIPLIKSLRNKGLRDRHWKKISNLIKQEVELSESLKLTNLIDMNLDKYLNEIQEISDYASKEYAIELNLEKMEAAWKSVEFSLEPVSDSFKIVDVDEIQTLLDEQIILTQSMRASPYVKEVETDVIAWEKKLLDIQDTLDEWLRCQAGWMYLEPIFSSQDIANQLPKEATKFDLVDKIWRSVMDKTNQSRIVTQAMTIKNIQKNFVKCNKKLDEIQKSLKDYLETKRQAFPRLYFLSDDELLQILSETKDPLRVQPHLKKCFDGINELTFNEQLQITAMRAKDGEDIPFLNFIAPAEFSNKIELWLYECVHMMRKSLREQIIEGIRDYEVENRIDWILSHPGQVVLTVSQFYWTREVEEAMSQQGVRGVQKYMSKLKRQMRELIERVRGQLTPAQRVILGALTTIDVHAKDVVAELVREEIEDPDDFEWKSQMRYYWENNDMIVHQITSSVPYGYEYLGNSGRLVITPLTDRCYRTLMGALQLSLGGAPEGPAGTGKTETVKDLSKAVAVHCLVYNCSESLDTGAMEKFFRGLASSGAWSCFDEFNRIELEVLSVVAQQILQIQNALKGRLKLFNFMGRDISLNHGCAVFITMNPGYAGRSDLPDNLKALFRPVAMMVPDYAMIAEISLFSFGFVEGRDLARKIVSTYRLCSEQLSSQDHYDYGMRAVKAVLMRAGSLKRQYEDESEHLLMLRAIKDVNLPKFLSQDIPLFQGIVRDLFPSVEYSAPQYSDLLDNIKIACEEMHLQPKKSFIEKIIQLYEMIIVRHGLMLVGPSFGGKTSAYRVLHRAINLLHKQGKELNVEYLVMNPKAITMGQLYGYKDDSTNEWTDGILAIHFRKMSDDPNPHRKWLIFDGPVDALWIESMNTVLDDNRKLCLSSGEIIKMAENMNLIFEVADLAVASPATVSRCGMVYTEPHKITWRPLFESYMQYDVPSKIRDDTLLSNALTEMMNWLVPPLLNFVSRECKEYITTGHIERVSSLLRLFDSLLGAFKPKANDDLVARQSAGANAETDASTESDAFGDRERTAILEAQFLFSLVWSLGGSLDSKSRTKFDKFLRDELEGNNRAEEEKRINKKSPYDFSTKLPKVYTVYDYVFDVDKKRWAYWLDTVEHKPIPDNIEFQEIIVPTVDTTRYTFLLDILVKNQNQVLFVGPTGTGKSAYIKGYMLNQTDRLYHPAFLNFSARTSANQTQDIIESKLVKRKRGVMGATVGKKMIIFVDDLNLPAPEVYGAQPPIELLRQWQDHGGWFNRRSKEGAFTTITDVQFVAAMGPAGGGRNPITPRFTRHFNIITLNPQSNEALTIIFSEIADWFLRSTDFASMGSKLVEASVSLYNQVTKHFRPRPSKSHYTFNLRDLSKIFQGMTQMKASQLSTNELLLRLWCHESMRVFRDRLVNAEDRSQFNSLLSETLKTKFGVSQESVGKAVIFSNFMDPNPDFRQYEEIEDIEQATTRLREYLTEYNESGNTAMDLVLFKFAVEHVARISRIITQPYGNALLIGVGGSGRQSLTRLATHAAGYNFFQVALTKTYNVNNWRDDLKELLMNTGMKCQQTVFLFSDTQIKHMSFLEDINNMLNTGEVPNLFTNEEMKDIQESLRKPAREEGKDQTPAGLYNYFVERCRKHLHIVVCMSPVGESLRNYLRMFPSLVNTTTIDWFTAWPQDALLSVARNFIHEMGFEDDIVEPCAKTMVHIHKSLEDLSAKYLKETKSYNYVTPTSYLDLLTAYKSLYFSRRSEILESKTKYDNGIKSINETEDQVAVMQRDLEVLKPKLLRLSKENEELSRTIEKESIEANETRKVVEAEEEILNRQNAENEKIREECQQKLDLALPALRKANKALSGLQKNHIVEVKSLKSPPKGVKLVMKAVCIIKNVNPVYVEESLGKKKPDYWEPAKKMMGERGFLTSLIDFDMHNINDSVVQKLKPVISLSDFNEKDLRRASVAAAGLAAWVIALVNVHEIQKVVRPRQEALEKAEAQAADSLNQLNSTKAQLTVLQEKLEKLENDKKSCIEKKEKLEAQFQQVTVKLDRAKNLLGLLSGEKIRWEQTSKDLMEFLRTLRGDTLLSAGIISYLGTFTAIYRNQVIQQWNYFLKEMEIEFSDTFSLERSCGNPNKIREWNIQGLPKDDFSIDNGIIVDISSRWPLFIDPQGQATKWIKKKEEESGFLVIKMNDPHLIKTIEKAIQIGTAVIIENIGEEIDPALNPLLLKQIFKVGGVNSIRLSENAIEYNDKFRFYMITSMPHPHYLPEVSTKVTIVNFMITPQGLNDQLLGIVVAKDKAYLEKKKNEIVSQTAENQKTLETTEKEILDLLADSENILEDDKAVNALANAKQAANKIKAKQKEAAKNEEEIDKGRLEYEPVAHNASNLFFVVSDLSRVDPMYQFSLSWYSDLFKVCIDETSKEGNRIQNLITSFRHMLFDKICRSIFEKDKLLLAFLMCVQIMRFNEMINETEWRFLLTGGTGVVDANYENPASSWLIEQSWNEILALIAVPSMSSFPEDFVKYTNEWKAVYDAADPLSVEFPGIWKECTLFQRIIILRLLRPDKIIPAVRKFIAENLDEKFLEPPTFDIQLSFEDSNCEVPLIFILSPGVDPMDKLQSFAAKVLGEGATLDSVSLGQGQGKFATEKISRAVVRGNWVVLQNCHLAPSWMPTLEKIVDTFKSGKTAATFRLWLTSMPTPEFPISILQRGIKMTNEPPKGLKANLYQSWNNVPINSDSFFKGCDKPREFKKLLFGLCFFHAVVQERRKFGPLGWNISYEFNESDLSISLRQLRHFLDTHSYIPFKALMYLTGECNYGGRVTDDRDRRTLNAILSDFYCEDILEDGYKFSPSGIYFAPPDSSHKAYSDFIKSLPSDPEPEVFGLHQNASITKDSAEAMNLFKSALIVQSKGSDSSGKGLEHVVTEQAKEILAKLPQEFNMETIQNKFPVRYEESMNTVLAQELVRFNKLIRVIRKTMIEIQKALTGEVVMSKELEEVATSVFMGEIPEMWKRHSYPSLKTLGAYMTDLLRRIEFFSNWVEDGAPSVFWLSGFFFTQSFLTGIKQNYARKHIIEIDRIEWDFEILSETPKEAPDDGCYISGVFLEGARWDKQVKQLTEAESKKLFESMPVIWLKPCIDEELEDYPHYLTPLYKTTDRHGILSTTGHSTNYVMSIKIPTGDFEEKHWVKRGTALFL
eukprot:CAMPEP_0117444502 /NCGR_PEP_ID=MMETSP0759-20121206/5277_1 /TAXON_ID=63605 /ORGANISM="Percolomonas cosmopolitus, Strain WS" /LENGTH=4349 /DNA_ID=CAMNT_0005236577 /DNA_START=155 /DNA_END=13203 /DNA_ORIENTATION=-